MKVTVRKKPLTKGRHRLFLDYYPPLFNTVTKKTSRVENLRLYLFDHPAEEEQKTHNTETLALAGKICAQRQLDIKVQVHGLTPEHFRRRSFTTYFRELADKRRGINWHNWDSSVRYFQLFKPKDVTFANIDLALCENFKLFLLSSPKLRTARRGIGHNSALSYFNKFRTAVKQAWREKLLADDFHALCPGLKELEAEIEFLTMEDVRQLINTPVANDMNRRAVLFAILTGLRFCDIKHLTWEQVRGESSHYYLQFRQRKTYKPQHVYISDQAFGLLGCREAPEERVFPRIYYNQIRDFLVEWPANAGIGKHITFSCLRHTYATLQLAHGTDIYTISKMLGHRHLKTTQRYTRVMDKAKQEAANRIVLDL